MSTLLKIKDLNISYNNSATVKDVDININMGEILGIVGESGSGKSTVLKSIIGLLGKQGKVTDGSILFKNIDLLKASNEELRRIRGNNLSMISQNPGASLCPIRTIEKQFIEAVKSHRNIDKEEIKSEINDIFQKINLRDVDRILKSYPFELSGGMNQRVGVALAMINKPELILADEPTSALDVTAQAQVVKTLMTLKKSFNTTIIIVTHNIGVVDYMADNIAVMYHGKVVEYGKKSDIMMDPIHPYTELLIKSTPTMKSNEIIDISLKVPAIDKTLKGCLFASRCNSKVSRCSCESPRIIEVKDRLVMCHLYDRAKEESVI